MAEQRVVAVLGQGVVPADTPILRADDLGVLRGDGIFETMHVRAGGPWLLDDHLARMARSAARMELDLPPREALAELADTACAAWSAAAGPAAEGPATEGALRLICTRGVEGGGAVTVFATVAPIGEAVRRARREGLAVATAALGLAAAVRPGAPWLLGGAKTLSYAVNMASQRWGLAHGADDVLWVSADGYALEAPTSTLVWLDGDELCTVPADTTGILPGTTARWLLDHAGKLGWRAAERMIRPGLLSATDGAWLASSVRGLAAVRTLDGATMPASRHTSAIRDLLGFPA